jgi:glycosyltransferase involved in cell wall biosynthesis
VIPPLIRAEEYCAISSRRKVAMINPRPIKGGAIAVAMAEQCPDIPFQFVEAWNGSDPEVAELKARAKRLNNIEWLPVQKNIRHVYEQTRLILAPSQCPETWGRVVTEAQFLGIPAIASSMGALPETVGAGGIIIDAEASIDQWVQALRNLWDDAAVYQSYADAALNYSQRAEISPTQIATQFIGILEALLTRRIEAAK